MVGTTPRHALRPAPQDPPYVGATPRRTLRAARSAVGRGYAPDALFAATRRALCRSGSAEIRIKSFRAVTARATFLCLCKETWRKESTPRLRARCCAPGSRSRRDFPSGHPARAENAAHPCAAPCGSCPPAPPLRRGPGGQDQDQDQDQGHRQRHRTARAAYNAAMPRDAIEIQALKSDSFGRISLMRDDAGVFVRRDLRHVPWWLRLPAWWLARREARGLRRADGLGAMPRLLGWDGRILDRSYLDGAAMYQRPPHGDLAYFRAARRLLQRLHRRGVAHNDLAKEANWLVLADGSPALIDFQLAVLG